MRELLQTNVDTVIIVAAAQVIIISIYTVSVYSVADANRYFAWKHTKLITIKEILFYLYLGNFPSSVSWALCEIMTVRWFWRTLCNEQNFDLDENLLQFFVSRWQKKILENKHFLANERGFFSLINLWQRRLLTKNKPLVI